MPRLISHTSTPLPERGTFVGRVRELAEFRNSVRYLLGKEPPPGGSPLYPHIFLPHGEGGMGKSSLLHQFLRVAREEGLPSHRIIVVDLDYQPLPTPEALAQFLAQAIGQKHPDFDRHYKRVQARRAELVPRYRELKRQWERWEALRGTTQFYELLDTHRRTLVQTEIQRAKFGAYEPIYLATQAELALDELAALQGFRDERGHAPRSFDELLRRELGPDATLFGADSGLGQAMADDIYILAEAEPLLLAED